MPVWLLTHKIKWPAIIAHLPCSIWGYLHLQKYFSSSSKLKYLRSSSKLKYLRLFSKLNYLRSSSKLKYMNSSSLLQYLRMSCIYTNIWGRLSFTEIVQVVFHLQKYLRSSSSYKNIWGRLPFKEYLRSSSIISQNI